MWSLYQPNASQMHKEPFQGALARATGPQPAAGQQCGSSTGRGVTCGSSAASLALLTGAPFSDPLSWARAWQERAAVGGCQSSVRGPFLSSPAPFRERPPSVEYSQHTITVSKYKNQSWSDCPRWWLSRCRVQAANGGAARVRGDVVSSVFAHGYAPCREQQWQALACMARAMPAQRTSCGSSAPRTHAHGPAARNVPLNRPMNTPHLQFMTQSGMASYGITCRAKYVSDFVVTAPRPAARRWSGAAPEPLAACLQHVHICGVAKVGAHSELIDLFLSTTSRLLQIQP